MSEFFTVAVMRSCLEVPLKQTDPVAMALLKSFLSSFNWEGGRLFELEIFPDQLQFDFMEVHPPLLGSRTVYYTFLENRVRLLTPEKVNVVMVPPAEYSGFARALGNNAFKLWPFSAENLMYLLRNRKI